MHACCCCLTARWPLAENLVLSATVRSSSTVPRATSGLSAQDSNISDSMLQTRMPASYAHALRLLPSSSIDDRFFSLSPPLSTSFLRSPRTILPGYAPTRSNIAFVHLKSLYTAWATDRVSSGLCPISFMVPQTTTSLSDLKSATSSCTTKKNSSPSSTTATILPRKRLLQLM